MKAFVEMRGLNKSYQDKPAVRQLSLSIPGGAIFGLLGPNGAGKTTTISMLSGLLSPDSGEILVQGLSLRDHAAQVKALMGVVPQEIALYSTLSAWENLTFWGRLYGLGGAQLKARTQEVLELVGLTGRAHEPINRYSGGMKRRINIAAGLIHQPRLLLLDEPTVGVDPQSRRSILETIKELNARGMTVLYTSHYMEEVEELCSLVAVMDRGEVIAQGTLADLHRLVGDQDLVVLEVESAPESLDGLAAVPGVTAVSVQEQSIALTVEHGNTCLPGIITAATDEGIRINGVRVEQPNLETVFLHLTGRSLRD